METTKIDLFKGKKIRKALFQNEWWFSVVDVIYALTDSNQPSKYWTAMKARVNNEDGVQLSTICRQLKLESSDGKKYETDCANTEGIFRIIQSVPSPKAEPFKKWLAKVGYERVQEIENPELATKRTRMLYKLKGYSDDWIEKRMRGIAIREELTDEWQKRGVQEQKDYEILTSEISKATFGITPSEYKKLKGLKRENLRDHMDDFELIFTMLGERSTTEIHKTEDSKGLPKLKTDANRGGRIAGIARKELEKELGKSVVSKENYLNSKKNLSQITIDSYDKTVNEYIKNVDSLQPASQSNRFISLLKNKSLILDLGCGPGRDAKVFIDKGFNVIGIDLSEKMIESAKSRVKNAEFHIMDILKLKFDNDYFDGIWASASFLHIPKKQILKGFKESYRVLKNDGIFYISVKEGELEILKPDQRYNGVEKFWSFFNKEEIEKYLLKAGFNIIESYIEEQKSSYATNPWIHVFCKK